MKATVAQTQIMVQPVKAVEVTLTMSMEDAKLVLDMLGYDHSIPTAIKRAVHDEAANTFMRLSKALHNPLWKAVRG